MKNLTLIALLISLFQLLQAQDSEMDNRMILGGSMNFLIQDNTYPLSSLTINSGLGGIFSSSTNDTKNTTFAITPYLGKEINAHLMAGLQLDYRIVKYRADDAFVFGQPSPVDFERNSSQIGIGLFTRHIISPDKQFNFFIQPSIEYNLLTEEESQDANVTQEEKASFIELGVGAGLLYNISDKLRATLRTGGLSYVNGKWEIVDTDTKKDFSSFGTNISLSTTFIGLELRL